jgi:hypothetical protein
MDDFTYRLQARTQKDIAATDAWISAQRITSQQFADVDVHVCLLQAQKIARMTLQHHARFLCTHNIAALNGFLQKMAFGKSRSKLRAQHARAVAFPQYRRHFS